MKIQAIETNEKAQFPIIDIEIGKEPRDATGRWNNALADPIVFGCYYGNVKKIVARTDTVDKEEFQKKVKEILNSIPRPLYALNKDFEKQVLNNIIGEYENIEDVRDFKGKETSKVYLYGLLIRLKQYPKLEEQMNFDSKKCIEYWQKYNETKNEDYLKWIMEHNQNCLSMENSILKEKDFLKSLFKININNWVDRQIKDKCDFCKRELDLYKENAFIFNRYMNCVCENCVTKMFITNE